MITWPQWNRWSRIGRAARRLVGRERWQAMISGAAEELLEGDTVLLRLRRPVKVGDPVYTSDIVRPDIIGDAEDKP